uniref:Uncharacterized protein n=1 Tax=Opuntia streptacantha TaxID=393608 RepID=A0A7C9EDA3_OPUST
MWHFQMTHYTITSQRILWLFCHGLGGRVLTVTRLKLQIMVQTRCQVPFFKVLVLYPVYVKETLLPIRSLTAVTAQVAEKFLGWPFLKACLYRRKRILCSLALQPLRIDQ